MRAVITVTGRDSEGIIAAVSGYCAERHANILDISQTIVQDYFNMMMIVDTANSAKQLGDIVSELETIGQEIGVTIHCQNEDIFTKMHRI